MIFQALFFKNEKVENGFRTAYGSDLTADEENRMLSYTSSFLFAAIPWMIPFILFFPPFIKILSVFVCATQITYAIFIGSLSVVINELLTLSSIAIFFVRLHLEKKGRKSEDFQP
jgi:hypothetical protein